MLALFTLACGDGGSGEESPSDGGAAGAESHSDAGAPGQPAEGGSGGEPASDGGEAGLPSDGGSGGLSFTCAGDGARFVTGVIEHEFGSGQDFGQDDFPSLVLGPPKGAGAGTGSLDVTSLGDGGFVTLEFEGNVIVDGPGADFIVFENAFVVSAPDDVYAELGRVLVSQDGQAWIGFECQPDAYPYEGCAGWHPVLANADENDIDPLDPGAAGGDAFDLADLDLDWARYVRIEDLEGDEVTFDLDAVAIVNAGCP